MTKRGPSQHASAAAGSSSTAMPPSKICRCKGLGPSNLPAEQNTHTIQSLPENTWGIVFKHLSLSPGATGRGSKDALSLASTCRGFNEYYRHNFVVALDLSDMNIQGSTLVFRCLQRLPRLHTIDLSESEFGTNYRLPTEKFSVFRRKRGLLPVLASRIKTLCVGRANLSQPDRVRDIVSTYCNLECLDIGPFYDVDDFSLEAIADKLSGSLQTLILTKFASSDAAGIAHFPKLRNLKTLRLIHCWSFSDTSLIALSELEELQMLDISYSAVSDAALRVILPKLQNLRILYLKNCCEVRASIFPLLPPSLIKLDLSFSDALYDAVPDSALVCVPHLKVFRACGCHGITDLAFVEPISSRIENLILTGHRASDANVAMHVSSMPNLAHLNLGRSRVADETARAISALTKITKLALYDTNITDDGIMALARGNSSRSLIQVEVQQCRFLTTMDDSMTELKLAVCQKGRGRVFQ